MSGALMSSRSSGCDGPSAPPDIEHPMPASSATFQTLQTSSAFPSAPTSSPPVGVVARGLNPGAMPFVPAVGGISYESAALADEEQVCHFAGPSTVTRPDFGRILIPSSCTDDQMRRMLAGGYDDDGCSETGEDSHPHQDGGASLRDEMRSDYSRGASTHRPDGDDGVCYDEAHEHDYDSTDLSEYDDYHDGINDPMDEDDDEQLTEEERAWLEAQCEAKDNPPGFFW